MQIRSGQDILQLCQEQDGHIYDLAIRYEQEISGKSPDEIRQVLRGQLQVMQESTLQAIDPQWQGRGKIIGGEAQKLRQHYENNSPVCGMVMARAVSFALGAAEVNACMGRIVAAPTAGSCGVLPGVLFSLRETHQLSEEKLIEGLLTAGMVGLVIAKNASLSGAESGCQAEIGAASAMGAAAVVAMIGGTPEQALHGAAMALKNLLGLVCDPVAGLVECPCAKRNAIGTANALIAGEMALAGISSVIPFDEVVEAMNRIGRSMPGALRETSDGGLAVTPTGRRLKAEIFGQGTSLPVAAAAAAAGRSAAEASAATTETSAATPAK